MSDPYKLIAQFWERGSNNDLVQSWKKNLSLKVDGDTDILTLKQSVEARYLAVTKSNLSVLEFLDGDDCSIEWNAGAVVSDHFVHWKSAAGASKDKYTLKIVRSINPEEQERRRREGTVSYGGSIDLRSVPSPAIRSSASANNPSHPFHGLRNPDQPMPSSERDAADAVVIPDTPLSRKRRHSREHDFRPAPASREPSLMLTHTQQQANTQPRPTHDRSSTTPKSESPSERNLQQDPELPVLTTIEHTQNEPAGDVTMTNGVEARSTRTPSSSTRRQINGFSTLDHPRSASKEALRRTSMSATSPRERVWEPTSQESRSLFKKPTPLKRPTKALPNGSARPEEILVNGTASSTAPASAGKAVSQTDSSVISETSQEASARQTNGGIDVATPSNASTSNGNGDEDLDTLVRGDVTPEEMEDAMNIDVPEITVGETSEAACTAATETKRKTFGHKTPTQNRPDFVGFERNSPKSILRRPSFASDTGASSNSTGRTTSPNLSRRSVEFHAGPPSILGQDDESKSTKTAPKKKGRGKGAESSSESDESGEEDSDFQSQAETEEDEEEEEETPKAAARKAASRSAKKAAPASSSSKQEASKQGTGTESPRPSTAKKDGTPNGGSASATPGGDPWAAWREKMMSNVPASSIPPKSATPATAKSVPTPKTKVETKASATKAAPADSTHAKKGTKTPVTKTATKTAAKPKPSAETPETEKPVTKKATAGNKSTEKSSGPAKDVQKSIAESTPGKSGVNDGKIDNSKATTTTPVSLPAKKELKKQPSTMELLRQMKERSRSAGLSSPAPTQIVSKVPDEKSTPGPVKKARVPPGSRAKDAAISARPPSRDNATTIQSASPALKKLDSKSSQASTAKSESKNTLPKSKLTDAEKIVAIKQEHIEPSAPARTSSDAKKIAALQKHGASNDQPHEISSAEESSSDESDAESEIPGTRSKSREPDLPKLPSGASKESSAESTSDDDSDDDSEEDADAKLKAALNNGPKSSQSISLTPPAQRRSAAESEATTEGDVEMPDADQDKATSVTKGQKQVPRAFQSNEDEELLPSSARTIKPLQPAIDFSDSSSSEEYEVPAPRQSQTRKPITKRAVSESSQTSSEASAYTRLPLPKQTPLPNGKKSASQATTESPPSTQGRVTSQLNSEAAAFPSSTLELPKSSQFGTFDTPTPAVGKGNRRTSANGRGNAPAPARAQLTSAQKPAASLSRMIHKRAQSKSSQSATPTNTTAHATNGALSGSKASQAKKDDDEEDDDDDEVESDDGESSNNSNEEDDDDSDAEKRPGSKAAKKKTAKASQGWMSIVHGLPLHL